MGVKLILRKYFYVWGVFGKYVGMLNGLLWLAIVVFLLFATPFGFVSSDERLVLYSGIVIVVLFAAAGLLWGPKE